jgi:hypothetical protein
MKKHQLDCHNGYVCGIDRDGDKLEKMDMLGTLFVGLPRK